MSVTKVSSVLHEKAMGVTKLKSALAGVYTASTHIVEKSGFVSRAQIVMILCVI